MVKSPLARLPEPVRNALRVARLRSFDTSTAAGRSDERYRRIVLSVLASVVGRGLNTVAALVSIPIVIAYLGKERYGLWATITALTPWVALADLGIVGALVNPLAQANGRDDHDQARRHLATALATLAAAALGVAVLFVAALPFLPWQALLGAAGSVPEDTVRSAAAVAFLLALAALPLGAVSQAFVAYQKAYLATAIATGGALLSLTLLLAGVASSASLPVLIAAANLGALLAAAIGLGYLLLRSMPWLRPHRSDIAVSSLRRILASSVPLYLFQIGSLLVNQSQQLIIARRVGLATVAEYDLVFKVYVLVAGLITLSTSAFAPSFREAYERGEAAWMRRGFWHLVRIRLAAAIAAAVAMVFAGNAVFRVWLRRADFQYDARVWVAVAVLVVAAIWTSSFLELMTVLDRIWAQVGLVLVQGGLTVVLTWTLTPSLGVFGALLAITIPAVALTGWILPWTARGLLRHAQKW